MYRSNILVIDRLSGLHCHYFLVISIRRREFLMRPTSQLQSLADNQAISRRNPTKAARAGHFLRSLYPYSFPLFPVTCRVEHRGTIDSQARKEDVQCDPRVSQMLTDCYRQWMREAGGWRPCKKVEVWLEFNYGGSLADPIERPYRHFLRRQRPGTQERIVVARPRLDAESKSLHLGKDGRTALRRGDMSGDALPPGEPEVSRCHQPATIRDAATLQSLIVGVHRQQVWIALGQFPLPFYIFISCLGVGLDRGGVQVALIGNI